MAVGKTSPRTITIVLHLDTSRVSVANCLIGDSTDRCLESILEIVQDTLHLSLQTTEQRTQQRTVADLKALDEAIVRPLENGLATVKADLITVKNETVAVRSLPIAPRAEVINRYIVLQPHRDEFDQVIGQVKDQVHKQLLTDLGNRIDRDFQSEIRRIALEAHHDLDDTVTNTNARMHEQIGTVKDLSKAHNKLAATVKDLQTTMQKQNEQLKYDTEQREESSSLLLSMQDESTLASLASDSVSKAQKELDAQALHVTNYSATVDEMKASISRTDSYTKQRINQLEATVLRQATTISTLTKSNEALSTVNTNLPNLRPRSMITRRSLLHFPQSQPVPAHLKLSSRPCLIQMDRRVSAQAQIQPLRTLSSSTLLSSRTTPASWKNCPV